MSIIEGDISYRPKVHYVIPKEKNRQMLPIYKVFEKIIYKHCLLKKLGCNSLMALSNGLKYFNLILYPLPILGFRLVNKEEVLGTQSDFLAFWQIPTEVILDIPGSVYACLQPEFI